MSIHILPAGKNLQLWQLSRMAKGARIAGALPDRKALLDEVDALEGEVAERALVEAFDFLAHRHDRQ